MKLTGRTKAIVKPFPYSTEDLARFVDEISASDEETRQLLLKYPNRICDLLPGKRELPRICWRNE